MLCIAALAGCANDLGEDLPPAPPTVKLRPTQPTTTGPDRSTQTLPVVVGATTTTRIKLQGGKVTLRGTVIGPDGPVAGATVRFERIVGDQTATIDTRTGANGAFAFANIFAGRGRIRAWRSPDVVQVEEVAVFATAASPITLEVESHHATEIRVATSSEAPIVGQLLNVGGQVASELVDIDGVARTIGVAGVAVSLEVTGALVSVDRVVDVVTTSVPSASVPLPGPSDGSEPPVTIPAPVGPRKQSDGEGRVTFTLRCNAVGSSSITLRTASGVTKTFDPPACRAVPTTPPPTVAPPPIAPSPIALPPSPEPVSTVATNPSGPVEPGSVVATTSLGLGGPPPVGVARPPTNSVAN